MSMLPADTHRRLETRNTGHGHVFPRPDGARARCGGPAICAECSRDAARHKLADALTPAQAHDAPPDGQAR